MVVRVTTAHDKTVCNGDHDDDMYASAWRSKGPLADTGSIVSASSSHGVDHDDDDVTVTRPPAP
jgi:hypothetical protein